jgi:hypothetical protein
MAQASVVLVGDSKLRAELRYILLLLLLSSHTSLHIFWGQKPSADMVFRWLLFHAQACLMSRPCAVH